MKTRKELKEEYKQMKFQMGVYQIRNLINGKIFIGSSLDLKAAQHSEKLILDFGRHNNSELQKDWKEMGADNFVYEIVDTIKQADDKESGEYRADIKELENMHIEKLQPFGEKGYNKGK